MKLFLSFTFFIILTTIVGCADNNDKADTNKFMRVEIFPLQKEHTHGSTLVELPNGDLLASWFQGHGERWADDVRIMGSRLLKGKKYWSKPFVMADIPGFPDINPVLFIDQQQTLWLVWYTVIANQWSTSLPKYRISKNYMQKDGPPQWKWQDDILFKPGDKTERGIQPGDKFVRSVEDQLSRQIKKLKAKDLPDGQYGKIKKYKQDLLAKSRGENMLKKGRIKLKDGTQKDTILGYPYFRRMGWQTKNKAVFVDNRIIIPFYSDGFSFSMMAITDDFGKTWKFSDPLVGAGNIQPSIAFKKDGTLVAYMRDNGPGPKRHMVSESKDKGLTWSMVKDDILVNEGSGSDIVTLDNGHWIIAYNDTEDGRYTLAVSLSEDEGKTWKYTRHIEQDLKKEVKKRDKFSYPSIIQGKDGMIHVVYTCQKHNTFPYDNDQIKYIRFNEEWIKKGDQ